ncbi:MAG: Abi family protein, partial [Streptococcus sp.]|nr:Abi family protein [Streptococcus sp.]
MDKKPKLSINNLIKHLSDKGISFKYHSKEEIIDVLENKTYYYKLSSYRKNFPKTPDKKYINLDFKALVDLASIDTYFREII